MDNYSYRISHLLCVKAHCSERGEASVLQHTGDYYPVLIHLLTGIGSKCNYSCHAVKSGECLHAFYSWKLHRRHSPCCNGTSYWIISRNNFYSHYVQAIAPTVMVARVSLASDLTLCADPSTIDISATQF